MDNGQIDSMDEVKESVKKDGVPFPVLWDKDGASCAKYGIRAYPAGYLVGTDGKVVWEGVPSGENPEIEKALKAELEKVKKNP